MATEAFTDFVVGHGELWAALLFSATVKSLGFRCAFMDTREVLVVTPTSDGNSVDIQYDASNARLDSWVQQHGAPEVIVATGFIAKNPLGQVWPLNYFDTRCSWVCLHDNITVMVLMTVESHRQHGTADQVTVFVSSIVHYTVMCHHAQVQQQQQLRHRHCSTVLY